MSLMQFTRDAWKKALTHERILFLLLVLVAFVYYPGLKGDFFFDDEANILLNKAIQLDSLEVSNLKAAAFSSDAGVLKRPVSMLSFAINYYFSGLTPYSFKRVNLLIHLVNVIGIFFFSRLILRFYCLITSNPLGEREIFWISLAATACWALHPFNMTSVLYVVQRMTSLSALFTIWGLVFYVWGRYRQFIGKGGLSMIFAAVLICAALAVASKENGVLLMLYMLVLELSLFRFNTLQPAGKYYLYGFFTIILLVPGIAICSYLFLHPEWLLSGYQFREFTLHERLLTEARVLWFYMQQILMPNISSMGLYHDDIAISHGLLKPPDTLLAILGLAGLAGCAFYARRRAPMLTLGILWFFAGHVLESTIVPLEIAHEHRNYLPMYGILLCAMYYLLSPLWKGNIYRLRAVAANVLVLLLAITTAARAEQFGNELKRSIYEATNHPDSARSNYQAGRAMLKYGSAEALQKPEHYMLAKGYFENTRRLDKGDKSGIVGLFFLNHAANKPVEPEWLDDLKSRLANQSFILNDSALLANLVDALVNGYLVIPEHEVISIFEAALKNETLSARQKGLVLSSLRDYYLAYLHDSSSALEVARQAAEVVAWAPEFHLEYATQLLAMGKLNAAEKEIELAMENDKLGIYKKRIGVLRAHLLSKMKRNSAG